MYAYVVYLFPQAVGSPAAAPPPPRALFEDFFVASPSTHLPVFLDWFAHVRTSLSEADARLASLLASGRPDSSLLPQRMSQYAVHGDFASSAAVPVNPSLLSMFERSLRPSLQLGISLREAALMESSSRFHSEALSHSLWLRSALLASKASLFHTLVTSLSKCLAHQSSISASFTAFLSLKRCNFYLSHLPAYFSEANKRAMLAAPLVCAGSLFAESDVALGGHPDLFLFLSRRWWMWLRGVLERIGGAPALIVLLLRLLLAVAVVVLALLLVLRRGSGLTLLLPPLLLGAVSRVFDGRGHVRHPVWLGLV